MAWLKKPHSNEHAQNTQKNARIRQFFLKMKKIKIFCNLQNHCRILVLG